MTLTERAERRFPKAVYSQGTEPDARFTLANERTFLAWIRTALALLAAGVALELLGLGMHGGLRTAASLVLLLAGLAVPPAAWIGWMRTERALRLRRPLPSSGTGLLLGLTVLGAGALIVVAIVLGG